MRFVDQSCVRCHREVAHRITTWDPTPTPVRHKAEGEWCSGQPKRAVEIIGEILRSLDAERALLWTLTDAWVAQGEVLVRVTGEITDQRETTIELLRAGGEAARAELTEAKKARK